MLFAVQRIRESTFNYLYYILPHVPQRISDCPTLHSAFAEFLVMIDKQHTDDDDDDDDDDEISYSYAAIRRIISRHDAVINNARYEIRLLLSRPPWHRRQRLTSASVQYTAREKVLLRVTLLTRPKALLLAMLVFSQENDKKMLFWLLLARYI